MRAEISNIEQNLETILDFNHNIRDGSLKQSKLRKTQSSKVWTKANSTVFTKKRKIHPQRSNCWKNYKFRMQRL